MTVGSQSPVIDTIVDILAGSFGGAVGCLMGHPADVVKVRMMNSTEYSSMLDCTVRTWRGEGLMGFTRGFVPPVISQMAYQSVVFASFHVALKGLTDQPEKTAPLSSVFWAGCAAGAATITVTTPSELIKIRLQLTTTGREQPLRDMMVCGRAIYRTEGMGGLFRGWFPTLVRDTPSGGLYFLVYHGCQRWLDRLSPFKGSDAGRELVAGGLAGMLSWGSIIPLDVIKTRMQAEGNPYKSMGACFVGIARVRGTSRPTKLKQDSLCHLHGAV